MRPIFNFFFAITVAIFIVVFCFFSYARSEISIAVVPKVMPPVALSIPTFFENLSDPGPGPVPEPNVPTPRRIQLALTRICVSESGFQIRTNDCTLIYHALRSRSRTGEITLGIMRAYSSRTFDVGRADNRRWIPHLNHNFTEPRGWRETATIPWSSRRPGFISVYEHVRTLLSTQPENPCDMRVDHWGSRGFRRRLHLSNGWRLINCGETLNDFWSLPRGEESRDQQTVDNASI